MNVAVEDHDIGLLLGRHPIAKVNTGVLEFDWA